MGLEQLRVEVVARRSAARLSQKRAAAAWHVPEATIIAVEKGVDRNYRMTTIGRFDEPFGWEPGTAWAMLHGAEPAPAASVAEVEALRLRVDELAALVAALAAAPLPSNAQARLLSVLAELDDDEVAQLTATAEWLAARRRRTGT
jgi:hypothetical protein